MEEPPAECVRVELDTSETPFLSADHPENPPQHRNDAPEVETSKGRRRVFRDRRTLYFCIGVLTASVVAVCVFVGMHFQRESSALEEDCVNTTMPSAMLNVQGENTAFSCTVVQECPKHCVNNMCAYVTASEHICTCKDKCEPDYKLLNSSGRFICIPQCCATEESLGHPCCPAELANVTSDSGELLCCPRHLSQITRNVIPPFLESNRKHSGQTVDLCYTTPPPGRTLGKEHVDFPSKPLTCM